MRHGVKIKQGWIAAILLGASLFLTAACAGEMEEWVTLDEEAAWPS